MLSKSTTAIRRVLFRTFYRDNGREPQEDEQKEWEMVKNEREEQRDRTRQKESQVSLKMGLHTK